MRSQIKTRVIVAEDDTDILDLVLFKLTQAGFEVDGVTDGDAALAAIEAKPPKLAILDIVMPGLSGLDVLANLRAREATKNLDVILLTARARDCDVAIGMAAGASDYVIKPFSPNELLQRIDTVLSNRKIINLRKSIRAHSPLM